MKMVEISWKNRFFTEYIFRGFKIDSIVFMGLTDLFAPVRSWLID